MPTAAFYGRVSTAEQAERQTIETQREFAHKYADLHGLGELLEFADEGFSGTIPLENRPGGNRLLQAAKAGLVSTIYVYKLDRLGRSAQVILNAKAALDATGARLVSMTEPFDTRDASGQFLLTVLSGVAALERDNIAERTSAGARRAAREGRWVCGTPPYGYQVIERPGGNYLEPDEAIPAGCILSPAGVVRLCYQRVGAEGWSTVQAQNELRGLPLPPRTEPGARNNRFGEPVRGGWHAADLATMLRKEAYKGVLLYGRKSKRGVVEATCPALVSPSLWEETAERLTLARRKAGYATAAHHFLSGVGVCGRCGFALCAINTRKINGDPYRYYRCTVRRVRPSCTAGILLMEEADNRVWRQVVRMLESPEAALRAAEERFRAPATDPDELAALDLQLGQLAQAREMAWGMSRRGRIGEEELERRLAQIDHDELKPKLRRGELQIVPVPEWRADAEALLIAARARLPVAINPLDRREVLRLLVRRVVAVRDPLPEWVMEWRFVPQSVYLAR